MLRIQASCLIAVTVLAAICHAEDVVTINGEKELDEFLEKNPAAVVEFFAPWCGHCKRLAPEYETAAGILKKQDPPIALAAIDMTTPDNQGFGKVFGIEGFPTLKIFRKKVPSDYQGPRESAGIVQYLTKAMGPSYLEITAAEVSKVEAAKENSDVVVVGVVPEGGAQLESFVAMADKLRQTATFFSSTDAALKAALGVTAEGAAVVVIRKFDKENAVLSGDLKDMEAFVEDASLVTYGELTQDAQAVITSLMKTKRSKLILMIDSENKESVAAVDGVRAAIDAEGKASALFITWCNGPKFPQAMSHFGVEAKDLPAVLLLAGTGDDKFKHTGAFSSTEIAQFARDALDGKVKPFVKSEPIPDNSKNNVKILVRDNLDDLIYNSGKDVFLKAYAPWCGHCKSMIPAYEAVGEAFSAEDSVTIAKVDATANDLPAEWSVTGFPTLLWFRKGEKAPKRYDVGRDESSMVSWILDQATDGDDMKKRVKVPEAPKPQENKKVGGGKVRTGGEPPEEFVDKVKFYLNKRYKVEMEGYYWAAASFALFVVGLLLIVSACRSPAPASAPAKKSAKKD